MFVELLILIIAAFIGGFAARSFKFPPVLGYIASGVVFGLIGKNVLHSYENLSVLSEVGVTLLLFTLGFEFSFDYFKKLKKNIIFAGVLQILLTSVVLFPLLVLLQLSIQVAILFAVLFAFSSTAVIVKLLEEKGILHSFPGNQVFTFLLIQDLFVVPVIFLMPLIFSDSSLFVSSGLSFVLTGLEALAIFLLIMIGSKIFLTRVLNILFKYPSHELTILATIFIAAGSIALFEMVGVPQTIGAFLAGMLISEQGKNLSPLSEIRPLRDILLVLFFVMTGMLVDMQFVLNSLPIIFGILIVVLLVKFFSILLVLRNSSFLLVPSVFIASYLANIGEFSIVLGQIAVVDNYITQDTYNLLLSTFVFSLVLIPFWTKYTGVIFEKLSARGIIYKKIKLEYDVDKKSKSIDALRDHVVICGHGRVGKEVRSILDAAGISYVVVDFSRKVAQELRNANKKVLLGDPSDSDVLMASDLKDARALVVAVPESLTQKKIITQALRINPKIVIICRSHIDGERYDLLNMGANSIVIPEFEAGLKIGEEILSTYKLQQDEISSLIRRTRRAHHVS